jgi:hypothetical protein
MQLTCCFTLFCGTDIGFLLGVIAALCLGKPVYIESEKERESASERESIRHIEREREGEHTLYRYIY